MLRRAIGLTAGLAVLWCLWWAAGSLWLGSRASAWMADRRAEGWQAELSDTEMTGFPGWMGTQLHGLALADPGTGLAVTLDSLTLRARAIWPGDIRVDLPQTPISLATPEERWTVLASDGQAALDLHPGAALELERLALSTGPFRVETEAGARVVAGTALNLALAETEAPAYRVSLDVTEFAPGDIARDALALPGDWPRIFDILAAVGTVTFDAPIDRRTLEDRRPQPVRIDLDRAEALWGDLRLHATGAVIRDAAGFAEGKLTVKAENWPAMLDMAEASGLLSADLRPRAEGVLGALARATGSTRDLDLTLSFSDGLTRLGFVPLGPAPRLLIR